MKKPFSVEKGFYTFFYYGFYYRRYKLTRQNGGDKERTLILQRFLRKDNRRQTRQDAPRKIPKL
jgi:hypothetical protein